MQEINSELGATVPHDPPRPGRVGRTRPPLRFRLRFCRVPGRRAGFRLARGFTVPCGQGRRLLPLPAWPRGSAWDRAGHVSRSVPGATVQCPPRSPDGRTQAKPTRATQATPEGRLRGHGDALPPYSPGGQGAILPGPALWISANIARRIGSGRFGQALRMRARSGSRGAFTGTGKARTMAPSGCPEVVSGKDLQPPPDALLISGL